jgi:CPA1 family monovalent cation:H+ antiporter
MSILDVSALLLTLAALFSYLNYRYFKLPTTIGLMLIALGASLLVVLLGELGLVGVEGLAKQILAEVDFDETLLEGMLSFLLFAGALHVNLDDLSRQKAVIGTLATVGVVVSTLLVGGMTWLISDWLGLGLPFIYCLLFGALISPTDPIAVLSILKTSGAPKSLETKITGESLFNDGIGVVVFLVLLGVATGGELSAGQVAGLFAQEAVGGVVFGLLLGGFGYYLLKNVDEYQVEVLITLALVMGGYALAHTLHLSGPIAVVVAGLMIGNHGRQFAMSEHTRERLDTFWELVDEILNAVLFVLIGLEILLIGFKSEYFLAAGLLIPAVLLARLISVGLPIGLFSLRRTFSPNVVGLLTWGGLRGGISVALALSLPEGPERDLVLAVTYAVVIFSIAVQGLTIAPLVRRSLKKGAPGEAAETSKELTEAV